MKIMLDKLTGRAARKEDATQRFPLGYAIDLNRAKYDLRAAKKLMGRRIAALPSNPVHNTVQFTGLLKLGASYDCTLSPSLMPFPL